MKRGYGFGGNDESALFEYAELLTETDRAWLLKMADGIEEWFPKSYCNIDKDDYIIDVPDWLWRKKGLS
jgi:hypothetical protein